jgi:hypothetical protein
MAGTSRSIRSTGICPSSEQTSTCRPCPPFRAAADAFGSTGQLLNGALESQLRIQKRKWSVVASGLWAEMSSTRATPYLYLNEKVKFGQLMIGREVLPHFYLEGGFRRETLEITAQLGGNPQVQTKPDLWDPWWDSHTGET